MNEIDQLERIRSQVPRPGPAELRAEESRLLEAITAPASASGGSAARRPRMRRLGFAAAGLAAVAMTAGIVVAVEEDPAKPPVVRTMPVASVEILKRAADRVGRQPELHPRPGQFLLFESRTMNVSENNTSAGHSRYLARSMRKVWLPVEGDSTKGVLETRVLPPKPYPGWPIPSIAREGVGRVERGKLADFDQRPEHRRTDYAYVSRLPADPEGMYRHLYRGLGDDALADYQAWTNVGALLDETYMPAPQRAALYRAAASIRGVAPVGKAVDAAGRTGIAVAKTSPGGVREEYIFDPQTYRYLGRRSVVVDAEKARAPVGSVLSSTALLGVTVVDRAPTCPEHDRCLD